jgi:hypothetical protein
VEVESEFVNRFYLVRMPLLDRHYIGGEVVSLAAARERKAASNL